MIASILMGAALLMAFVWLIDDAVHMYREQARKRKSASFKR